MYAFYEGHPKYVPNIIRDWGKTKYKGEIHKLVDHLK